MQLPELFSGSIHLWTALPLAVTHQQEIKNLLLEYGNGGAHIPSSCINLVFSRLIGLFVLLLLASYAQPPKLSVAELENQVGKIVVLDNVTVSSISYKEDAVFLKLEDSSGQISAVFFGNPKYEIIKADKIAVKGKVQLYKGDLEIIIQELACLSCS